MNTSQRVVVIGTGPAGATAAVFLVRAGFTPLVLEAGPPNAHLGLTARIHGFTIAKKKPPLRLREGVSSSGGEPRLFEELAPGGLSNHWACAVPRFSPEDFADAARAGEEYTWPLGYEDVAPWYERVEPLLRIAGSDRAVPRLPAGSVRRVVHLNPRWEAVVREAAADERDVVAMPYAFGSETTLTHAATPFNAYTRLLKPAERAGVLRLRYDARVERLEYSARERRVSAVVCRDPRTGYESVIPCGAVVLAAGAVNSAEILLRSESADHPSGLGNSRGLVGRYLHDHPLAKLVVDVERDLGLSVAAYVTRASLDRSEPLYAAACMQWGGTGGLVRALLRGGRTRQVGFSVFGTMIPRREDGIALEAGRSNGQRRLRLDLQYPCDALATLERARDEVVGAMTRAGWAPRVRVFKIEKPGESVHYGGTCRMHASPEFGVADGSGRLHDVRNVVVADSAVFTTGPEKNPVLTAMALAARSAFALAEDLRGGVI